MPVNSQVPHRPNFFIVGAPKCGTTSMYHYLRAHPEIFMPYDEKGFWKAKEPHFFADDLGISAKVRVESRDTYLNLFRNVAQESRIGESSALYLYSTAASANIKENAPNAKIIIMLRPPVELMRSWHQDCLRFGHEDIADFTQALEAEEARRNGKRIPENCAYPSRLIYTEMGEYAKHVQRYQTVFGSSNTKVFLLEDLEKEPARVYQETLEFLEVDSSYAPEYAVHHKGVQSGQAQVEAQKMKHLILKKARFIFNIFQKLSPQQQEQIRKLFSMVLPKKPATEISPLFLNELRGRYKSDIVQLGDLIERDLEHWYLPT